MRMILIENNSGFIFGDTADLPRHTFAGDESPITQSDLAASRDAVHAARWLDEAVVGEFGRGYEFMAHAPRDTGTGYRVYRADVDGSDAVPVVQDGQDRGTIEAVERDCEFIGYVAVIETQAA